MTNSRVNKLKEVFKRCKRENRAAMVGYLTAGDPNIVQSDTLIAALAKQVDIIEIGMPFSDPAADGATIQAASERSLAAGTKLIDVFKIAKHVHTLCPKVGIILMGYANVPYTVGFDEFAKHAKESGADGVLLVDVPAEESAICSEIFKQAGLSQIMLLAPTSSEHRIQLAANIGSGFIYYVSLAGITGAEMGEVSQVKDRLSLIRQYTKLPICVGFGIKSAEQAHEIAAFADGVVVGSHFVSQITTSSDAGDMLRNLTKSASLMASAMSRKA